MNKQQLKKTTTQGDFIFHKEWLDIFQGFSTKKAGQIIKALVDYAKNGVKPADPEIAAICTFLFANVDIDRERIAAAHAPRKKAQHPPLPQNIRPRQSLRQIPTKMLSPTLHPSNLQSLN